ncbi:hypothetical protein N9J72_02580 [Candidatus Gracilibacteria bacterium]|nr:hypothetical protein [Candidatus Gracilibacteria bacterium]
MNLCSNGIKDGSTSALIFSGYGVDTKGDTVQQLFDAYEELGIPAHTIDKPGTFSKSDKKFCSETFAQDIVKLVNYLRDRTDKIILVGNSVSNTACVEAIGDCQDVIAKYIGIAPVFDLEIAILNRLKAMGNNVLEVDEKVLESLGIFGGTNLDIPKVLTEIEKYRGGNHLVQKLLTVTRSIQVDLFLNMYDQIINPDIVQGVSGGQIHWTPQVEGDPTFHNVSAQNIIDKM